MKEQRIIERMVDALRIELSRERTEKNVNFPFLDTAIDFFKTYADRCHHGKEEGVLFRELSTKSNEKVFLKVHFFAFKRLDSSPFLNSATILLLAVAVPNV